MSARLRARYNNTYLRRIVRSLRDRGIAKTLRLVREERWYELRHGIRVSGIIELDHLAIQGGNKSHGYRYEAVNHSAFRLALSLLEVPLSDYAFIDLGCGKGFALILASQCGFKKLIGVEFSSALSEVCRRNLTSYYEHRRPVCQPPFEIFDLDVTEFVAPPGNIVFFMCNPFDEAVVRETFRNLLARTAGGDGKTFVVYVNALHRQVLIDLGFTLLHFFPKDPLDVYQNGIAVFRLDKRCATTTECERA